MKTIYERANSSFKITLALFPCNIRLGQKAKLHMFSSGKRTYASGECDQHLNTHRLSEGLRGGIGRRLHARLSYRGKTCPARLVYWQRKKKGINQCI